MQTPCSVRAGRASKSIIFRRYEIQENIVSLLVLIANGYLALGSYTIVIDCSSASV